MQQLPFHPEALLELNEAVIWHERERTGYGALLFSEVTLRVEQAARLPRSGSPLMEFETRYDVRKYVVRRFRYVVITALVDGALIVIAVAHTSRKPGYWRARLARSKVALSVTASQNNTSWFSSCRFAACSATIQGMPSSFPDKIKALAKVVPQRVPMLETEEATKNALIMPFLSALGYDVFDPTEVVPEFTADVGTKKGEKVDYAIKRGEDIIILIEAKKASEPLSSAHSSQLYRYFSVTKARIGILTNGVHYQFFSDLEEPNKMDSKAFLELNLNEPKDAHLEELTKLTKDSFDLEDMLSAASDLKYIREIRRILEAQFESPDEDFVRFFFSSANPTGRFTQGARTQFTELVKKTLAQVVTDRVGARLRSALAQEDAREQPPEVTDGGGQAEDDDSTKAGVVTTEEEMEGYRIVRAIVRRVIDPQRVTHRDTKSYFGILVDDNNRKPLCRLHFNRSQWYVGLFGPDKNEQRHPISAVEDIYGFTDSLTETAQRYLDHGDGGEPDDKGSTES